MYKMIKKSDAEKKLELEHDQHAKDMMKNTRKAEREANEYIESLLVKDNIKYMHIERLKKVKSVKIKESIDYILQEMDKLQNKFSKQTEVYYQEKENSFYPLLDESVDIIDNQETTIMTLRLQEKNLKKPKASGRPKLGFEGKIINLLKKNESGITRTKIMQNVKIMKNDLDEILKVLEKEKKIIISKKIKPTNILLTTQ